MVQAIFQLVLTRHSSQAGGDSMLPCLITNLMAFSKLLEHLVVQQLTD